MKDEDEQDKIEYCDLLIISGFLLALAITALVGIFRRKRWN